MLLAEMWYLLTRPVPMSMFMIFITSHLPELNDPGTHLHPTYLMSRTFWSELWVDIVLDTPSGERIRLCEAMDDIKVFATHGQRPRSVSHILYSHGLTTFLHFRLNGHSPCETMDNVEVSLPLVARDPGQVSHSYILCSHYPASFLHFRMNDYSGLARVCLCVLDMVSTL